MSLASEVAKAWVVTENIIQGQVLGNLNDVRVENMTRVIGRRNLDQCSLAVGTTSVRNVAMPAASLAEHSNCMKIKASM